MVRVLITKNLKLSTKKTSELHLFGKNLYLLLVFCIRIHVSGS